MRLPITALLSLTAFLLCTLGSIDAAMAKSSSLRSAQSESLIAYVCIQDKSHAAQNQRQLWECHGWDFVSGVRVNWYSYVGGDPVNLVDPDGYSARTFAEGFVKGAAIGVPTGALIALGLASPVGWIAGATWLAVAGLTGYSAYNVHQTISSGQFSRFSDDQRHEFYGSILGGFAGGSAGGSAGFRLGVARFGPKGCSTNHVQANYEIAAQSGLFKAKLAVSNAFARTLGKRSVTPDEILSVLSKKNTVFKESSFGRARVDPNSKGGLTLQLSTNKGYLNQTVAHHELLHVAQFLRQPSLYNIHSTLGRAARLPWEIGPASIGSPEILVGLPSLSAGGAYASFAAFDSFSDYMAAKGF